MVQEEEEEGERNSFGENASDFFSQDSSIKTAHDELLDASRSLLQLADWCDENFTSDDISNEEVKYNQLPSKLYGGKTLKTTGQFAIKAIHAVAYNVGLLAASLESNVSKLGAEIKDMSDEIDVLTVQTRSKFGKDSLGKMKKLTTTKIEKPVPTLRVLKESSWHPEPTYVHQKLDFTALDQIGYGGARNIALDAKQKEQKDESEKKVYATVKRTSSVKTYYSTGTRSKDALEKIQSMTSSKKVEMPKVPLGSEGFSFSIDDSDSIDEQPEIQSLGEDLYEEIPDMTVEEIRSSNRRHSDIAKRLTTIKRSNSEDVADVRLSFLPPMPMLVDNTEGDEDFDSIMKNLAKNLELLGEEFSQELEK